MRLGVPSSLAVPPLSSSPSPHDWASISFPSALPIPPEPSPSLLEAKYFLQARDMPVEELNEPDGISPQKSPTINQQKLTSIILITLKT